MKRCICLVCLSASLFGCAALGTASYEQPLVVPGAATADGDPCTVTSVGAGKVSWHGIDFAGSLPTEFAMANGMLLVRAGEYLVFCGQKTAIERALELSYGGNAAMAQSAKALKLGKEANRKFADLTKTLEANYQGASTANEAPSGASQPQAAATPNAAPNAAPANASSWFIPLLYGARNYTALIIALDDEARVDPDRSQLCRTFSDQLKIEMAKDPEDKNFRHAQTEVIKAFVPKGN
jgi:hypothetical protein